LNITLVIIVVSIWWVACLGFVAWANPIWQEDERKKATLAAEAVEQELRRKIVAFYERQYPSHAGDKNVNDIRYRMVTMAIQVYALSGEDVDKAWAWYDATVPRIAELDRMHRAGL